MAQKRDSQNLDIDVFNAGKRADMRVRGRLMQGCGCLSIIICIILFFVAAGIYSDSLAILSFIGFVISIFVVLLGIIIAWAAKP